jgi:response regulator of citrate/malate metabolism
VIRTLIVDDDFMVAAVNRAYVERVDGFTVVGEAHTGADALAMTARLRPDLILLDIYLPDLSGLEVLRRLRASELPDRAPVDVLVVTAARDVETVRTAMHGGVFQYLVKPFSFVTLREKLEGYAALRARLAKVSKVADQTEVDRLYELLRPTGSAPLPKGLSRTTLELIGAVLAEASGDLSAVDVAERTGVSRVTARRYLEFLCETGQADLALRYGSAGRPEHRYQSRAGGRRRP